MNKYVSAGMGALCGYEVGYGASHHDLGWMLIGGFFLAMFILVGAFTIYRDHVPSKYLES